LIRAPTKTIIAGQLCGGFLNTRFLATACGSRGSTTGLKLNFLEHYVRFHGEQGNFTKKKKYSAASAGKSNLRIRHYGAGTHPIDEKL
jgi:hypothetical protein